jgi:hypothetical protein
MRTVFSPKGDLGRNFRISIKVYKLVGLQRDGTSRSIDLHVGLGFDWTIVAGGNIWLGLHIDSME